MATFWPEGLWIAELKTVSGAPENSGYGLPDDTVRALANHILNLILVGYIERDLSRSSLGRILLAHVVGTGGLGARVSAVYGPGEAEKTTKETIHGKARAPRGLDNRQSKGPWGSLEVKWGKRAYVRLRCDGIGLVCSEIVPASRLLCWVGGVGTRPCEATTEERGLRDKSWPGTRAGESLLI